jgi:DNA polymerase-4
MTHDVRYIAHLDMDAFYASVELLKYPELRGLPVVIGGGSAHAPVLLDDGSRQFSRLRDYAGRGVATTSTYEARALGVFSAIGLMKAAKLAPDAVLLPTDFDAYRRISQQFKQAVKEIAPDIEDRGIDEIYIDLSEHTEEIATLAGRIKQAVRDATGLSCSIGVASNKLLAKICSDLEKPNGTTILTEADLETRIWPLNVRKVNGIGPKATEKLAALEIHTIGQLAQADMALLHAHFGPTYAGWLYHAARGLDDRPIRTSSEPKSLSRETTFERDLEAKKDRATLSPILEQLCARVADDLTRKGYLGRTVGIKLRFADFSIVTRDFTLPNPTADAAQILTATRECLRRVTLTQRMRLLGVRVSALSRADAEPGPSSPQGELFAY